LPDTLADIVRNTAIGDDAILGRFLDRAKASLPTCLIRLGDGEGKLLGYPDHIDPASVANQVRIWFGDRAFEDEEILELRTQLLSATAAATFIGLPTQARTFATDPDGAFTRDASNCQALWSVLHDSGIIDRHDLFGSAMIHRNAQVKRWFATLLGLGRPVVFVTRTHIAVNRLVGAFGIEDYHVHLVPGETWSRKETSSTHFPERFHAVRQALARCAPGTIGLGGSGGRGKIDCADIARAGGAAFDCGALFDTWAGDIPHQRRNNMPDADMLTVAHLKGR
jgi:hypothetical protein